MAGAGQPRSVATQTEPPGPRPRDLLRYRRVRRYLSRGTYSPALSPQRRRSVRRFSSNFTLQVGAEAGNKFQEIFLYLSTGGFSPAFGPVKKKNLKRFAQKFVAEGGCLYYVGSKKNEKREVVADRDKRREIFLECHFSDLGCHLGQKKTVHRIQSRFYWLGIVKDVVDWIKTCETCQRAEQYKNISRKYQPMKVTRPWEILGIDLIGPFPESSQANTYVLAVTDYFTKWVEAIPLQRKGASCVAKALAATFYRFGASKDIYSSEGRVFCEEVSRALADEWNINHTVTPAERPQHTGLDHRTSDVLKAAIRNVVSEKPLDWDECLDPVLFEFRTSVNSTTKFTPFFLLYNREARLSSQGDVEISHEYRLPESCDVKVESVEEFTAAVSNRQSAIKDMVISNLAAAHKREKKNAKRKAQKAADIPGGGRDFAGAVAKKHKKNQFLSFQIETTLPSEHSLADVTI